MKLAEFWPAGIDTEVIVLLPAVSLKTPVPLADVERFTVSAVVVGLLYWSCSWTVNGPERTFAVGACATLMKTSLLAKFGLTVSCCVAWVRTPPASLAVIVGVPAWVSRQVKLAEFCPAGIDTEVIVLFPAVSLKTPVPLDVERFTVSAVVVGLLYWSCSWTVIVVESTPAVRVCATVVKTSLLAKFGLTVSCCVAEVRTPPASLAVIVGVPAWVSRQVKLAEFCAAGIDTEVIVLFPAVFLKTPMPLDVERFTVSAVVVGLLYWSCSWTVTGPERTPAVSVCATVVKTSLLAKFGLTVSCCVAGVRTPPASLAVIVGVPAWVSR